MKTYKGFDKDFKCRDFQYEVGKEYEMPEEDIAVCKKGFHACESPLEVFDYYFMDDNGHLARFAKVEQTGRIDKENGSTKVCSSKIKIISELKLGDFIKAGVEWIKESVKDDTGGNTLSDKGDDYAKIGSSGNSAQIGSSGNGAQIGSSGDGAQIGSSGCHAQIGSSGNGARITSTGKNSVICCAGNSCVVSAKKGSWVTLSEWGMENGEYKPLMVKTIYIDGKEYKEDTPYTMKDKEIIEYTPQS